MVAVGEALPRHVFDKAKFHEDDVLRRGLPTARAATHTAIYLGWLAERDLLASEFKMPVLTWLLRWRMISPLLLYSFQDRVLVSDMLRPDADRFSRDYFDFEHGEFIEDYCALAGVNTDNFFTARFNWRLYRSVLDCVDERFEEWCKR